MKTELAENVIEKIVILKYTDGSTGYALHLTNGGRAVVTVGQLMSARLSMGSIIEATGKWYVSPNQKGWVNLIRGLLECAEEKKISAFPELDITTMLLSEWLTQWNSRSGSEKLDTFVRINDSCVIKSGIMFFKLSNLKEKLFLQDVKITRTFLCGVLRKMKAKRTEPVKRFGSVRIRTWEIATSDLQP